MKFHPPYFLKHRKDRMISREGGLKVIDPSGKEAPPLSVTLFTIIAPTVPQDVISTSKSSSHLLVRWKPPVQRNGNITYYLVLWQRLAEDGDLYINDYCHRGTPGVPQTGDAQWRVDRCPDLSSARWPQVYGCPPAATTHASTVKTRRWRLSLSKAVVLANTHLLGRRCPHWRHKRSRSRKSLKTSCIMPSPSRSETWLGGPEGWYLEWVGLGGRGLLRYGPGLGRG